MVGANPSAIEELGLGAMTAREELREEGDTTDGIVASIVASFSRFAS
jgi:hypothetical protein